MSFPPSHGMSVVQHPGAVVLFMSRQLNVRREPTLYSLFLYFCIWSCVYLIHLRVAPKPPLSFSYFLGA